MKEFRKTYEVIWADIDPNRHMRHSVYYDYAAQVRVSIFEHFNLSMERIAKMGLGPILFREEARFFKEIHMSEQITVDFKLQKMKQDGSRWTIVHDIFKEDGRQAATITVDGAWIDLVKRKLGQPPGEMREAFEDFPRTDDFEWM
jgi:acyl-CoA thioester hydrolase